MHYSLLLLSLIALLSGCQQLPSAPASVPVTMESDTPPSPDVAPPVQYRPFPEGSLYPLLVAEFALHRQHYEVALRHYLQQSEVTQDAGIAQRATQIAQHLHAEAATLDAALLWRDAAPEATEPNYTAAILLARRGEVVAAARLMAQVLQNGAQTNFVLIAASALQQPEAEQQRLLELLNHWQQQHPDHLQLMSARALLLQVDQPEQALALAQQAVTQDPSDEAAQLLYARLLHDQQRTDEAIQALRQALAQQPEARRLRLQLARFLARDSLQQAQEQFEILLQQNPDDSDLRLTLALIHQQQEQLPEAQVYLESLLDEGKYISTAHFYLGEIAQSQGDTEAALLHWDAIRGGEELLNARQNSAVLLAEQDRWEELSARFNLWREQLPTYQRLFYRLEARLLSEHQRHTDAFDRLSQALEDYPDDFDLLYARALQAEQLDRLDIAEADLRRLLVRGEDASVLNTLGYLLAVHTERLEEARQLIEQALQLEPDDGAILDSMGWVHFRQGDLPQAKDYLQRAYQQLPDAEVAAHYGEVLWRLGEQQAAWQIWQESLGTEPDRTEVPETLERLGLTAP